MPISVSPVVSGTLSKTLDFENFATARRLSQHIVNLVRQLTVDARCDKLAVVVG